ncbi:putative methyltransferase PMT13 [Glycine max]|nr:putative methyltransferase PMT13 [Glycine max]
MAIQNCFSKKPNHQLTRLYLLSFTTFLCTITYLLGLWHHAPPSLPSLVSTTAHSNCPNSIPTLNFSATHFSPDPQAPARDFYAPPCDPSLSEYTPCEDVQRSLKFPRENLIYRERHCPPAEELLRCRVPAPFGYRVPLRWPESRDAAWFANVPHKELTVEKKNQNWVRFEGDQFRFPGGGTMFPRGAGAYIDDIGKLINLEDGSIRTALDTGCGVASWGAYLLSRDIIAVSFAPRDTHEAQVQFALERGVPGLIGVLASIRLPYPSRSFDMAHCSRCLIPWGQNEGIYLNEVDRVLRPGGYWILSGPPINWENHWKGWERTRENLKEEQDGIEKVAKSLCWKKLVQKGDLAIWQKPTNHIHCKITRKVNDIREVSGGELSNWPERLTSVPPRISSGSLKGITAEMFKENNELWKKRVAYYKTLDYQLAERGRYRNLLDMNAYLGGFAAALIDDPVWVMNTVPVEAEVNTLGAIYERGLIGTYMNWCEAMSTYPRTYDFMHGDSVFSLYQNRCKMEDILLEMDRILRPQGSVILRDDVDVLLKVKSFTDAMQWDSRIADHEKGPHQREKILVAVKQWRNSPIRNSPQMGHSNSSSSSSSPSKRGHALRQWRLLDLVSGVFFFLVLLFFAMVFTPLGDSLAASGRQTLLRSGADPRQHHRLVAAIEAGGRGLEACPAADADHMPCEDPRLNSQLSREMNYYRERHCPRPEDSPLCLIPPPHGYRVPVPWPESLHKIWHSNMPYNKIADRKGHQGWMKLEGQHFIFPGGGTMFPDGAEQYIEKLGQYIPISEGVLRTALDMGCGVASFGGYMLSKNILTMSFAPRDSHKAQIQFALERGVPAFVAMLGTRRQPFPAFGFDLVHCSRLLRPGGYFVISGPPVQWPKQDKEWSDLQAVARALCYELIAVDGNTVIWKKPAGESYFKLKKCVSRTYVKGDYAIGIIPKWPERLTATPPRSTLLKNGVDVYEADTKRWVRRVAHYKNSLKIKLGTQSVRNVMDMNALFGGFAAALKSDPVWVMNVVPAQKPPTLDVIFDRGLIGVYHDWCEPFSTYPRSYDLIHVVSVESLIKDPASGQNRCTLVDLMVEIDRILRPEGTMVVRDAPEVIDRVAHIAGAVRWKPTVYDKEPESHGREKILVATKTLWKL